MFWPALVPIAIELFDWSESPVKLPIAIALKYWVFSPAFLPIAIAVSPWLVLPALVPIPIAHSLCLAVPAWYPIATASLSAYCTFPSCSYETIQQTGTDGVYSSKGYLGRKFTEKNFF